MQLRLEIRRWEGPVGGPAQPQGAVVQAGQDMCEGTSAIHQPLHWNLAGFTEPNRWEGCGGWDNDPDAPVSGLRFDRRAGESLAPILFHGQAPAALTLSIQDCGDDYEGDVIPTQISVQAAWADEENGGDTPVFRSGPLDVTRLPIGAGDEGPTLAVSTERVNSEDAWPIDAAVDLYSSVTWPWTYDIPCSAWRETLTLQNNPAVGEGDEPQPPDPAQESLWVATSHLPPVQGSSECTPKRIASVYHTLTGADSTEAVASAACLWGSPVVDFYGDRMTPHALPDDPEQPGFFRTLTLLPESVDDVWFAIQRGTGDCLTMAALGAQACRLAGVGAEGDAAFARHYWDSDWDQGQNCWWHPAGGADHRCTQWLTINGPGSNHDIFQGYFATADGRVWSPAVRTESWPGLAAPVTDVAVPGTAGYTCYNPYTGEFHAYGAEDHAIVEPTDPGGA